MRLKMKVAGSSWSLWWLLLCNCAGLLFGPIALAESSDIGQCEPLDSQTQIEFGHEDNLIEELASASKDTGKVPSLLDDVLETYDATPFWYNLIQAISLASGITPTTEALMHDLVTSSFSSDNLDGSIKKVLTAIKCNENKTKVQENDDQTQKQDKEEGDVTTAEVGPEASVAGGGTLKVHRPSTTIGKGVSGSRDDPVPTLNIHHPPNVGGESDNGAREGSSATLEVHHPPEPRQFADAQQWNPWDRILSALWEREQEWSGNDLIGPLHGLRLRRELRDRRRGGGAVADLHQPFFMSEVVPSSLVTRHPSIISVSGCPSGHIQDLRGVCRQIFQYTVNYGGAGNTGSVPPSPFGQAGSGERRRRPWLFGGRRPAPKPVGGSLRDVARESSLFKHSVMRGYVPPFIFSQSAGARNLQTRLGSRPQPSLVGNSVDGAAQENSGQSLVPSPVELMKTAPKRVMIGADSGSSSFLPNPPPPSIPSTETLSSLSTLSASQKDSGDDNQKSQGDSNNGGGGSSENFDSSKSRSKDEKRREEEAKEAKKAKEKYQSSTSSNNDDDD